MPNRHATLSGLFQDTANALRGITGSADKIKADDFDLKVTSVAADAGADAVAGEMLLGKKALSNSSGSTVVVTGTIPTKTDVDITSEGGIVTIPAGYYAKEYTKKGDPSGDATLSSGNQMLEGITAYSKGVKYTGTIPTKTGADLTVSGATVTAPAGYYATNVSKAVASGSVDAPTAVKGTVTDHSVSVTPSVTSTTGYITGGTQTGTAVTVSASELVSGSEEKEDNGTYDVTNLAELVVNVPASKVVSGTKNITTMEQTDVTNFKYALVVDSDIVAGNIKDGVDILGVAGTFTDSSTVSSGQSAASAGDVLTGKSAWVDGAEVKGSMVNQGKKEYTITTQGGTQTIPAGYHDGTGKVTASITASVLDNSIISGEAFEEETGDYAWRSTVDVPAGYHNAQTLVKTFSEIFPAPETPATATEMLLGYQAYNKSGKLMTGTMPNNGAVSSTISTQGGTYTVPKGYHDGNGTVTASISNGVITSGAGTAVIGAPVYNTTNDNFDVTATGTVAAPTVGTAGYVSATEGTKNTNTVSGSTTINKIVGTTSMSGTTSATPSIERQEITITGVTDAASGSATTTPPTSGVYVKVKSPENTGTLTASASITGAGYGTSAKHGITGRSVTAGAAESADTYVPITTTTATVIGKTVSYGPGWIEAGSSSVADGSVGTPTATKGTVSDNTITVTPSVTSTTGYIVGSTKDGTAVTVSASELVSGNKAITATTATQTDIDVTNFATVSVAPTPSEEKSVTANGDVTPSTGKLLSKVTVNVPTGPSKSSSDLTVNGPTVTAPAGLYAADASKSVALGALSADDSTLSGASFTPTLTFDSTNDNFTFGGSANATGTAHAKASTDGYVTSADNVSKDLSATVSATGTLSKVGTGVTISGASTAVPSIARQTFTIAGVVDAGDGNATTTEPTSGVYVKVKSASNTGTLTATPKVTTAGYGTSTAGQYTATAGTATVGADASADTYVPIKVGSATGPSTISGTEATITTGTNTIILTKTGVSTTPTVTPGYIAAGTASTSSVELSATMIVDPTPTVSGPTVTIPTGYYSTDTTKSVDTAVQATPVLTSAWDDENGKLVVTGTATQTAGYVSAGSASGTLDIAGGTSSVSGPTVTIGAGYYNEQATQTVDSGEVIINDVSVVLSTEAGGGITISGSTATISKSISVSPTITAGYVTSGTSGTVLISGSVTIVGETYDGTVE